MNRTLETNALPGKEFAAFAALDWGSEKHAWALQTTAEINPACPNRRQGELASTPEAVEIWAAGLEREFGGRPIALALEQVRGAVVGMLSKYAHIVLFPIHPKTLSSYRESRRPSGAKSDLSDAALLLEFLLRHSDQVKPLRPDTVETRTLRILVEERRKFVDELTAQSNRLTNWLKQYFPQVLTWFDDISIELVAQFLTRWPTLEDLQKAHHKTLQAFFHKHHSRSTARIQERIEQIATAVPATRDQAMLQAGRLVVDNLLNLIAHLRRAIADLEKAIEKIFQQHPDAAIMRSLPGAGPALAPRLIAALGTDRERFDSASQVQCYAGIAPVIISSGKQCLIHWRWACPKFIRQTMHEWAQHSLQKSEWARTYYSLQRQRGKSHHAAIRALAFKWIRILYRCWKDRKPYDATLYEGHLATADAKRPVVSVPAPAADPLKFQWKNVAGLWKVVPLSS
jgi:transposase